MLNFILTKIFRRGSCHQSDGECGLSDGGDRGGVPGAEGAEWTPQHASLPRDLPLQGPGPHAGRPGLDCDGGEWLAGMLDSGQLCDKGLEAKTLEFLKFLAL